MARELSQSDLATFNQKVLETKDKYKVPGASVTIVQNNKLIFASGYGVRNIETKEPMTPETVCPLGSMSKSFTALMNATQVDEGHFTWDTLVKDISPIYEFPNASCADQIKVYHLMNMSTGMGEPASIYDHVGEYEENYIYWNEQSPAYVIKSLTTAPIKGEPGTVFYYNNEVYSCAGYLSPLQQGTDPSQMLQAYKDLMYKKVFNPIGMTSTHITPDISSITKNYAVSYGVKVQNNTIGPLEMGCMSINSINGIAPAGQIVSNVMDLSLYAMTLLNDGVVPSSGHRVVSTENLQELWKSRIDTKGGIPGLTNEVHYGLGWEIDKVTHKNHSFEVYCHGGFLPAWLSWIQIVPDSNVGLAILTNNWSGRYLAMEMGQELLKLVYGEDLKFDVDVNKYYQNTIQKLLADQGPLPSSYQVERDDVAPIIGNYHGGWTVEVDNNNYLVLYKTGWIYYLFPSQAGPVVKGKNQFVIWASNHNGYLKGKENKVDFYIDSVWGVTMISAMGEVKRWAA